MWLQHGQTRQCALLNNDTVSQVGMTTAAFTSWCETHGTVISGVAAVELPSGQGRGLVATRELAPGEEVLAVPEALLMSGRSAVLRDSQLAAVLETFQCLSPAQVGCRGCAGVRGVLMVS